MVRFESFHDFSTILLLLYAVVCILQMWYKKMINVTMMDKWTEVYAVPFWLFPLLKLYDVKDTKKIMLK